jgi:hypothetical protein
MKIIINGKQVWPVPSKIGTFRYGFKKKSNERLVYTETPLDGKGNPIAGDPTLTVELDRGEVDSFMFAISKDQPPDDPKARAIVEDGLRRIDKLRKELDNKRGNRTE